MSTPDSQPESAGKPSAAARLFRALGSPVPLSLILGVLAFLLGAVLQPPVFTVVLALSLPFFWYVVNARWKDAAAWTLLTVPFQYYFNIGGLALTVTELYMFLFGAAYFLSRTLPSRSVAIPSLLALPALYALTPFLPCLVGKFAVAKEGVRLVAAVFFCPPRPWRPTLRLRSAGSWPAWS